MKYRHYSAITANHCPGTTTGAFGELFDRYGDVKVVLIGEASHGTSDFYQARAAITQRLIERHASTLGWRGELNIGQPCRTAYGNDAVF